MQCRVCQEEEEEKSLVEDSASEPQVCALASVAQMVGAWTHRSKGRGFDSWSGRAHTKVVGSVLSHLCFSLSKQ